MKIVWNMWKVTSCVLLERFSDVSVTRLFLLQAKGVASQTTLNVQQKMS